MSPELNTSLLKDGSGDGKTWCKICGITNPAHAELCSDLGVDAIGFAFVEESPRFIDFSSVTEVAQVARTERVGLFVNPDASWVETAISSANLTMLQFNGDEPASFCGQFGLPYLRAVQMHPGVDVKAIAEDYETATGLLLDTFSVHARGGTGLKFDWSLWPQDVGLPLILAGGLNSENVSRAILELSPSGVDVSGGVEIEKGKKDSGLIESFHKSTGSRFNIKNKTLDSLGNFFGHDTGRYQWQRLHRAGHIS